MILTMMMMIQKIYMSQMCDTDCLLNAVMMLTVIRCVLNTLDTGYLIALGR